MAVARSSSGGDQRRCDTLCTSGLWIVSYPHVNRQLEKSVHSSWPTSTGPGAESAVYDCFFNFYAQYFKILPVHVLIICAAAAIGIT